MKMQACAETVLRGAPHEVFEFATDNDTYERLLGSSLGPVGGIRRSDAEWPLEAGSIRTIVTTNGETLVETILEHTPPERHAYCWSGGLNAPARWFVRSGTGTWVFSEDGQGTRVVWTYEFDIRSVVFYPLAAFMTFFFRRWMQRGLGAMRAERQGE